ncbi:MAG: DNA-directed RNA polymerase subunit K [Nanoarchaeota archaeon]
MKEKQEFTKYEKARILGARALQIAMDAPLLFEIDKETLERIKYEPISIAEIEFNEGVLPITVKRPMPEKKHIEIKQKKIEISEEEKGKIDGKIEKNKIEKEKEEEKEITAEGEIMELAQPEDEIEEEPEAESGGEEA